LHDSHVKIDEVEVRFLQFWVDKVGEGLMHSFEVLSKKELADESQSKHVALEEQVKQFAIWHYVQVFLVES
jgi:hypothetical protein